MAMAILRRVLVLLAVGALLGSVVGTLIARSFIPWYESPGSAMQGAQALINLPVVVRSTIDSVIRYQLIGAAIGAAVVLVLGLLGARVIARRNANTPAAKPAEAGRSVL
jgi:hypothetical protein